MQRLPAFLVSLALLAAACAQNQGSWREVVTPHFRVRTDLDREAALRAGATLESTRGALLSAAWPSIDLPQAARAEVYVFADRRDLQPVFGNGEAWWVSGEPLMYFLAGEPERWESRQSLVSEGTSVLQEGMASQIASLVYPAAPRWFSSGLGQFLATLRPSEDRRTVMLGAVNVESLHDFRAVRSIPLERVMAWRWEGELVVDGPEHAGLRGASWALVHWLFNMRSEPFARYRAALASGEDGPHAWEIAFPGFDVAAAEAEMVQLSKRGRFIELTAPLKASSPGTFEEHLFTAADEHMLRARLAEAKITFGKGDPSSQATLKAEVAQALALDPTSVNALVVDTWTPAEQRLPQLRQAAIAHPEDARAWRLLASALPQDAAVSAERERAYRQTVALEPRDPEAINSLAWMVIQAGNNKGEALALATRAFKLRSADPFYLETYARALFAVESCQKALITQARVVELRGQKSDGKETLAQAKQTLAEYQAGCARPAARGEGRTPRARRRR